MTNTANRSDALPTVHLFNPANDEALASNNRWYTPSRHALQYQHDCELLSIWWANDGDFIIAPHHSDEEIAQTAYKANIHVTRYQPGFAALPSPWGWSHDAKRQFEDAGVPDTCLPSDEHITIIRMLSHRKLAIDVNKALTSITGQSAPNHPRLCSDIERLQVQGGEHQLLKRPWSCSGRGVFPISTLTDAELQRLAGGIIRRQGSVIIEDALDKIMDFSCLFLSDRNQISHQAWSLFHTTSDGRYLGSVIAEQNNIMNELHDAHMSYGNNTGVNFHLLQQHIMSVLSSLIGTDYNGWIGVDMLAYRNGIDHNIYLAPCIEVNLRMTMGVVATLLTRKLSLQSSRYLLQTMAPNMTHPNGAIVLAGNPQSFSVILAPT